MITSTNHEIDSSDDDYPTQETKTNIPYSVRIKEFVERISQRFFETDNVMASTDPKLTNTGPNVITPSFDDKRNGKDDNPNSSDLGSQHSLPSHGEDQAHNYQTPTRPPGLAQAPSPTPPPTQGKERIHQDFSLGIDDDTSFSEIGSVNSDLSYHPNDASLNKSRLMTPNTEKRKRTIIPKFVPKYLDEKKWTQTEDEKQFNDIVQSYRKRKYSRRMNSIKESARKKLFHSFESIQRKEDELLMSSAHDFGTVPWYWYGYSRPGKGRDSLAPIQRDPGEKINFVKDSELLNRERLFIEKNFDYDLDKFRIFISIVNTKCYHDYHNHFLRDLIFNEHWKEIFGYEGDISIHRTNKRLDPQSEVTHGKDILRFSHPASQPMCCVCKLPFEVWIEHFHAENFFLKVLELGWPCNLNPKRFQQLILIDRNAWGFNPPPIHIILSAISQLKVKYIMIRKQGMRWKARTGSSIRNFFNGLDLMRLRVKVWGGCVSLTHIDIAQEIKMPPKKLIVKNSSYSVDNDVCIPRWSMTKLFDKNDDDPFYNGPKVKDRKEVEYYPQYSGLTGCRDGGVTIKNPGAYKSEYTNGLYEMVCYNGTTYHLMRERVDGMPHLNTHDGRAMEDWTIKHAQGICKRFQTDLTKHTSLYLNEKIPKVMRTELRFRYAFDSRDKNTSMKDTFTLKHFVAVANDISLIRERWNVQLSSVPISLAGCCNAVQINLGQLLRELSRRQSNCRVRDVFPGSSFEYFKYLYSNICCNLGFSGQRVDQWKFQWLHQEKALQCDYDGISFLYHEQKRRVDDYEKNLLNSNAIDHRINSSQLLNQYGIPTAAGLGHIASTIKGKVNEIINPKPKGKNSGQESNANTKKKEVTTLAVLKWFLNKRYELTILNREKTVTRDILDFDFVFVPATVCGDQVTTRLFLDACDPTGGDKIRYRNDRRNKVYALYMTMSPRFETDVTPSLLARNPAYDELMMSMNSVFLPGYKSFEVLYDAQEEWDRYHELIRTKCHPIQLKTKDKKMKIDIIKEIDPMTEKDKFDHWIHKRGTFVYPVRIGVWLRKAPTPWPILTVGFCNELFRMILKKDESFKQVKFTEKEKRILWQNSDFLKDYNKLKRIGSRVLRLQIPLGKGNTHRALLKKVAAFYEYPFKDDPDPVNEQVVSVSNTQTPTNERKKPKLPTWALTDIVSYRMHTNQASKELTKCILQKGCEYNTDPSIQTPNLSDAAVDYLVNNPTFANNLESLRSGSVTYLKYETKHGRRNKKDIFDDLCKFYGYKYDTQPPMPSPQNKSLEKTRNPNLNSPAHFQTLFESPSNIRDQTNDHYPYTTSTRKYVGVRNTGNQCYSIAILQMLQRVPQFAMDCQEFKTEYPDHPSPMIDAYLEFVRQYKNGTSSMSIESFQCARIDNMIFSPGGQHCVGEFLVEFIGQIHKERKEASIIPEGGRNIVEEVEEKNLGWLWCTNSTCLECQTSKTTEIRPYFIQDLCFTSDPPVPTTLTDMFNSGRIDYGNLTQYHCEMCDRDTDHRTNRYPLACGPNIIFMLKRWKTQPDKSTQKLHTHVVLPSKITVTLQGPDRIKKYYFLSAVVCHFGEQVSNGHFVCYWKNDMNEPNDSNEWLELNDDGVAIVRECKINKRLSTSGYLLLYSETVQPFME